MALLHKQTSLSHSFSDTFQNVKTKKTTYHLTPLNKTKHHTKKLVKKTLQRLLYL